MGTRKRINLTVEPELYERLKAFQRRHGFKSVCQVGVSALRIIDKHAATPPEGVGDGNIAEEVADMFGDLSHHCVQPQNVVPPARRRREVTDV